MAAGNLPRETTSLIGRSAELADLSDQLGRSRLVTLTGPGGVGKTRLALRAAARCAAGFPDGVWWVGLSALRHPDLLAYTVAEALGVADQSSRPLADVLAGFLSDRHLLLVMDTCEHLVGACGELAHLLLDAAPGLTILATSRERLGVSGEHVFGVPPLPVPDPRAELDPRPAAAVDLFTERARAADPSFCLTQTARPVVIRLCRQLDGLPLAIELAAGWTPALPVEQISARLSERFLAVPRHETMRTAIGWSHELCSPAERLLWARLSVFPGEFGLAAATEVCADDRLPRSDIRTTLAALVNKSIVVSTGLRYRQLDTVREYGKSWLRMLGEQDAMRTRHLNCYLRRAREFDQDWRAGRDQAGRLDRMRPELHNVRAAIDHGLASSDALAALDLAGRLNFFWLAYALKEGAHHLDRTLAACRLASPERARALWARAWLAILLGEPDRVLPLFAECTALAAEIGDGEAAAWAGIFGGAYHFLHGNPQTGIPLLQQAAGRHRRDGDQAMGLPLSMIVLSLGLQLTGDPRSAIGLLEQARGMLKDRGEEWLAAYCDLYQVNPELAVGRPASARECALAMLRSKVRMRDTLGELLAIDALAGTEVAMGETARGARLFGIAQALADATGVGYAELAALRSAAEPRARELLGEDAYQAEFGYGHGLALDEALAYALGE